MLGMCSLSDRIFGGYCAKITGNPGRAHRVLHLVNAWVLRVHLFLRTRMFAIFRRSAPGCYRTCRASDDYLGALCLGARGRRGFYNGGPASDQNDLAAEFAHAIACKTRLPE